MRQIKSCGVKMSLKDKLHNGPAQEFAHIASVAQRLEKNCKTKRDTKDAEKILEAARRGLREIVEISKEL